MSDDHAHIFADHKKHLCFIRGAAEEAREMISRSLDVIRETQILLQEIERLDGPLILSTDSAIRRRRRSVRSYGPCVEIVGWEYLTERQRAALQDEVTRQPVT